jgi:hypothetical protein
MTGHTGLATADTTIARRGRTVFAGLAAFACLAGLTERAQNGGPLNLTHDYARDGGSLARVAGDLAFVQRF